MIRTVTIVTLALLVGVTAATAQVIEAGQLKVKLGGRAQLQFNTTNVDEAALLADGGNVTAPIPASTFETRRVRLGVDLDFGDMVTGKVEMEIAMARLQLRDTWMNLEIDPALQFRFGQFKKPFSLLQLTSSSKYPLIERAVRIRGSNEELVKDDVNQVLGTFRGNVVQGEEQYLLDQFGYQAYDLGAAVLGTVGRLTYQIGMFNGTGSDAIDDTNRNSAAGRITMRLLDQTPLTIGAGMSTRQARMSTLPQVTMRSGEAYEVDLEYGDFRRPGVHVLAEATTGTNLAAQENFAAAQVVGAWFQPVTSSRVEGWEIAGRASYGDPNRTIDGDDGILLTPGFNIYFSGRNRLMLNWDIYKPFGESFRTLNAVRAQAQVYF